MTRIAFTNVSIFDGSGEEPYAGDLLVEGKRICLLYTSDAADE